jgi:hypothetical protein
LTLRAADCVCGTSRKKKSVPETPAVAAFGIARYFRKPSDLDAYAVRALVREVVEETA